MSVPTKAELGKKYEIISDKYLFEIELLIYPVYVDKNGKTVYRHRVDVNIWVERQNKNYEYKKTCRQFLTKKS